MCLTGGTLAPRRREIGAALRREIICVIATKRFESDSHMEIAYVAERDSLRSTRIGAFAHADAPDYSPPGGDSADEGL